VTERTQVHGYASIVREGRILLCRISEQIPNDAGKWTLPGGGIDFDESIPDGVARELSEETGYEIELGPVAWVESEVFDGPSERVRVVRIIYEARVIGGQLRPEADGSTDLCDWIELATAPTMPLVPVARLVVDYCIGVASLLEDDGY